MMNTKSDHYPDLADIEGIVAVEDDGRGEATVFLHGARWKRGIQ